MKAADDSLIFCGKLHRIFPKFFELTAVLLANRTRAPKVTQIEESYLLLPRPKAKGVLETMACRILMFMWSFGPLTMGLCSRSPTDPGPVLRWTVQRLLKGRSRHRLPKAPATQEGEAHQANQEKIGVLKSCYPSTYKQ